MRHITCRCREVDAYDSTRDLERRIAPPREDARYATLERVEPPTMASTWSPSRTRTLDTSLTLP